MLELNHHWQTQSQTLRGHKEGKRNSFSASLNNFLPMEKCSSKKRMKLECRSPGTKPQAAAKQPEIGDIEDLFSEEETGSIRKSLLGWYEENQRDLPWRRSGGERESEMRAYAVWVSEVMLQQTRVQTVIDYYNRWMERWPTLHHLARASLEEVNDMWAGLGYYRRARFLLEGARMIDSAGTGFPKTVSALRKVPGIGDYTAGAIASIAFNEAVPVVDGNVIRALCRLKAISANPKCRTAVKSFWKLAAQLVDPSRPGDFNQSLMELGATICTPVNPSCPSCPVSTQCRAFSLSKHDESIMVTDYPVKVLKAKQRHDFSIVCVLEIFGVENVSDGKEIDSKFLIIKRPDEGLLAGLWEFPSVTVNEDPKLPIRRKLMNQFLKESCRLVPSNNCSIISREHVGEFVHVFTHIRRKIYVELLVLGLKGENHELLRLEKDNAQLRLVDNEALSGMGLTSAVRKDCMDGGGSCSPRLLGIGEGTGTGFAFCFRLLPVGLPARPWSDRYQSKGYKQRKKQKGVPSPFSLYTNLNQSISPVAFI